MKMELVEIDLNDVVEYRKIRNDLGDLTQLEQSVRELGLIFPLVVDQNNRLISGSRRLAACRNIGKTSANALRVEIDDDSMLDLDIQSGENLCRKPLTSDEIETVIALKKRTLKQDSGGVMNKIKNLFGSEQD